MKLETAKLELLQRILSLTDASLIKELSTLLDKKQAESDPWDEYPDDIKAEIEEAIAELDRGEGIPHEVVMKKYQKWLKR